MFLNRRQRLEALPLPGEPQLALGLIKSERAKFGDDGSLNLLKSIESGLRIRTSAGQSRGEQRSIRGQVQAFGGKQPRAVQKGIDGLLDFGRGSLSSPLDF
jgi:hypothetical protein